MHPCWFDDPVSRRWIALHVPYCSPGLLGRLNIYGRDGLSTSAQTHEPACLHALRTPKGVGVGVGSFQELVKLQIDVGASASPLKSVACARQVRSEAISGRQIRAEARSSDQSIHAQRWLAGWLGNWEAPALSVWYPSFCYYYEDVQGGGRSSYRRGRVLNVKPQGAIAQVASRFDPHSSYNEVPSTQLNPSLFWPALDDAASRATSFPSRALLGDMKGSGSLMSSPRGLGLLEA